MNTRNQNWYLAEKLPVKAIPSGFNIYIIPQHKYF